jgi:hypothetical protein
MKTEKAERVLTHSAFSCFIYEQPMLVPQLAQR